MGSHSSTQMAASSRRSPIVGRRDRMGAAAGDTLTVRIIPEPLTRAAEFEAGRLSVIEVPFGETARWRAERPGQLIEKPALRVVYVALNNRRGPLRDARVRRAINHAVNR